MKQYRFLFVIFALTFLLLSACGAGTSQIDEVDNEQHEAEPDTTVIGIIESMNGTEWIVNDLTLIVDPSVVHDGPYIVGDIVRAEGSMQPDGRILVARVEEPDRDDFATATALALGNPNDNDPADNDNDNDNDDDDNSGPGSGDNDGDNSGPGGGDDD